jgi:hypothetical protein
MRKLGLFGYTEQKFPIDFEWPTEADIAAIPTA